MQISPGISLISSYGRGPFLPKVGLLAYWRPAVDIIGLSTSDYLLVDPTIRDIFFIDADTLRPAADAFALALASEYLNNHSMLVGNNYFIALYTDGTDAATIIKAQRYAKAFESPSIGQFTPKSNVYPGAMSVSNSVAVTGGSNDVNFVVYGGEAEVNQSGNWVSSGLLSAGDVVRVRSQLSTSNVTLSAPGVAETFVINTNDGTVVSYDDLFVDYPETSNASLLNDLRLAALFDDGAGVAVKDRSICSADGVITDGTWDTTNGPLDLASSTSRVDMQINNGFDATLGVDKITIYARIFPRTTGGGGGGRILDFRYANYPGIVFFMDGTASIGCQVLNDPLFFVSDQRGAPNQITLNAWNDVFLEFDNTQAIKQANLFNGTTEITYTTDTGTSTAYVPRTDPHCIIGNDSPSAKAFDGKFGAMYVWGRLLSPAEKAQVIANPAWIKDLNDTAGMSIGIVSDIHKGDTDVGTQDNSKALDYLDSMVARMRTDINPDFVYVLGDYTKNSFVYFKWQTDFRAVAEKLNTIDAQIVPVSGNHDFEYASLTEIRSEIDIFSYVEFEPGKLYGTDNSHSMNTIILDGEYINEAGYPHADNTLSGFEAIIPDGTGGSDNESGWISTVLANGYPSIVATHRDLADIDLTGNKYFSINTYQARYANSSDIRQLFLDALGPVVVFSGHTHWYRTAMRGGVPYVTAPSLIETADRQDSSDRGQWLEVYFFQGYCRIDYVTDDTVNGPMVFRSTWASTLKQ